MDYYSVIYGVKTQEAIPHFSRDYGNITVMEASTNGCIGYTKSDGDTITFSPRAGESCRIIPELPHKP